MNRWLLALFILSSILFVACSSVKYQCLNGDFVNSADGCEAVSCPRAQCPDLDCAVCPAKIEYKDRIVEKPVYVDKPVYQYQCFDGSMKDSVADCSTFKQNTGVISTKCSQEEYQEQSAVDLRVRYDDPENGILSGMWSDEDYFKWYPSLSEGKVYGMDVYFKNTGCTKIAPKVDLLLMKDNSVVAKRGYEYLRSGTGLSFGTAGFGSDRKQYYPDDWSYSFESFKFMDGITVKSPGTYSVRVIVKDDITGDVLSTAETQITLR